MAAPAKEPTQEILGSLYDQVDKAADYAETVCLSLLGIGGEQEASIAVVAEDLSKDLKAIRDRLHDLVEWA